MKLFDAEGRISVDSKQAEAGLKKTEAVFRETMGRIDRMRAEAEIDADISRVETKMAKAEKAINKFKRQRAEAKTDVEAAEAIQKLIALDAQMRRLDGKKAKLHVELDKRHEVVAQQLGKIASGLNRVKDKADGTINPLTKLGNKLNQARVTLGPLSLSLRALTVGLAVAGPAVIHVAGALGSLVGILGTATVGAAGLAGSALTGFGVIFGGLVASIKANKDLFALKGKTTKSSLKDDLLDLQKTWGKLTRTGAKGFLGDLQKGLQNVRGELPMLAKHTNKAFDTMGKGLVDFSNRLTSKEGGANLDKILTNSNKALRPLLAGFNNLGQAGLRVSASFSRFLPSMGKGFGDWTKHLLDATNNTDKLDKGVNRVVRHAKLVGDFFLQAGRAVKDVFNRAAGDGEPMVKRMAGWMKDIQHWAKSDAAGRFFDRAREGSHKMLEAAGQILPIIARWVVAMEPFSNAFLDLVTSTGKFLNGLLDAVPASKALVQGLAGLYVLNKAAKWARSLRDALVGTKLGAGAADLLIGGGRAKAPKVDTKAGDQAGKTWGARFLSGARQAISGAAAFFGFEKLAEKIKGGSGAKKIFERGLIPAAAAAGRTVATKLAAPVTAALASIKINELLFGHKMNWEPRGWVKDTINGIAGIFGKHPFKLKFEWDGSANQKLFNDMKRGIESTQAAQATLGKSVKGRKLLFDIEIRGGASATRTLRALGATKLGRKTLNIIAQGGPGALRLIKLLGSTKIGSKVLRIIQRGGPEAARILNALSNKTLRQKILRILERGGAGVQKRLEHLLGFKLGTSTKKLNQVGGENVKKIMADLRKAVLGRSTKLLLANDQATGKVNALRSITSLGSATKNIFLGITGPGAKFANKILSGGYSGAVFGYAQGGDPGKFAGKPVDARIAKEALGRRPLPEGGGIVRQPTILEKSGAVTGEERRTEVVIATNPAYKKRNLQLWGMAGHMLGVQGFATGGIPGGGGYFPGLEPAFKAGPKSPKLRKPSWYGSKGGAKSKRSKSHQKKAIGAGAVWEKRIEYLQGRETELERDASIKESQVKEPESFLRQTGTTPDGTPTYEIAWDLVKKFRDDMSLVQNVYNQIWKVVQELRRAIPQAIKAQKNEINARRSAISGQRNSLKHLRGALGKEEARGKRKRPKEIARLRKLISKSEASITKHGQEIGDSKTLIKDYQAEDKDSGFRLREAYNRAQDYQADINAVGGRALKEKADATASGAAGDTGSATAVGGPSPVQLLGSARYDLLSQFGGNYANVSSSQAATGMALGMSSGGLATNRLGAAIAKPIASAVIAATANQASDRKIELHTHYNGGVEDTHTWAQRQLFEVAATGI